MSKKILGAAVVLTVIAAVFAAAPAVKADAASCSAVKALISAGLISADKVATAEAAAGCTSTSAAYTFTRDLTVGSTGADVTALQMKLGVTPATGYFGNITKAAVMAYQTSKGLPSTGFVGPMTRAALNYVAPVVVNNNNSSSNTSSSNELEGSAGSLSYDSIATYSSEDVKAGDENAKVLGFEAEADDESDVKITSVKVELEQTVSGNSDRIEDYMDSVSVWLNGKQVGSADADSFTENSDVYTKSITLKNAVIKAGEKGKIVIAVNAASNLDSGDIDNDNFNVDVVSVRFTDGDGVSTTDNTDGENLEQTFQFEDLATSGDLEVKISEASSNPEPSVVEVDDISDTNDVTLLAVNMKATGSEITVDELNFNITPTGANANVIVGEYKLVVDGEEIDSLSPTSIASGVTGNITFTDLQDDFVIPEGDSVVVKLVADINDTEGTFGNGDSILASLTNTNLLAASSTMEDENGDDVSDSDRVGSVTGNAQTFYTEGIMLTVGSVDAEAFTIDSDDNDRAELTITFKVTAFGQVAYIPTSITGTVGTASSSVAPSTAAGVTYHVQSSDTGLTTSALAGGTLTSTADEKTNSFKVDEGSTETFTLVVKVTNSSPSVLDAASVRALLTGVAFASTDSATGDSVYTSDLTDYRTGYASIAN